MRRQTISAHGNLADDLCGKAQNAGAQRPVKMLGRHRIQYAVYQIGNMMAFERLSPDVDGVKSVTVEKGRDCVGRPPAQMVWRIVEHVVDLYSAIK